VTADDRWLTPDDLPGAVTCRPLLIPDEQTIIAAVAGALLPLTYANNWQAFGAVTPAAIAVAMKTMFEQAFVEPCGVTMQIDLFTHEVAQNVAGGGLTANTEATLLFPVSDANNIGNVSYAAGVFTPAVGLYKIDCWHVARAASAVLQTLYFRHNTIGQIYKEGLHLNSPANVQGILRLAYLLNQTDGTAYRLCVMQNVTRATDALGFPVNYAGRPEVYGEVVFTRIGEAL